MNEFLLLYFHNNEFAVILCHATVFKTVNASSFNFLKIKCFRAARMLFSAQAAAFSVFCTSR